MKYPLVFQWNVAPTFGWGIYGINLLRHWNRYSEMPVFCGSDIHMESFGNMDVLAYDQLMPHLAGSVMFRKFRDERDQQFGGYAPEEIVALYGVSSTRDGNALTPGFVGRACHGQFAVTFIETTDLGPVAEPAKNLAGIIAGSTWNEELLRANGVENVATVFQGVDLSLFHPGPRAGYLEGRFAVFSGGKLEFRKGQDLVVRAFKIFAETHPDAILVTAWQSHWPQSALSINRCDKIVPIGLQENGTINMTEWAVANGINANQFKDLGFVPNHLMGRVLREVDVAVFPNRGEGGTNLVAMECMASGLPTIVANNTGQRDLVNTSATYPLLRQNAIVVPDMGTDGWGESDVDEIVAQLEAVYNNRQAAREMGIKAWDAMSRWSWRNQIGILHHVMCQFLG